MPPSKPRVPPIRFRLDETWSDDHGVALQGWIFNAGGQALDRLEVSIGGLTVPVTSWHARPDVAPFFPGVKVPAECGFRVYIPRMARHEFSLTARFSDGQTWEHQETLHGHVPYPPGYGSGVAEFGKNTLLPRFIDELNSRPGEVLEIGSRLVSPGAVSNRRLFGSQVSYTGFDFHPDANTDVVGDAHRLSTIFAGKRYDGIFSFAVFEHLAMPWVVAAEIARSLKVGGLSYQVSTFAWPNHARPNDYWRFSDDAYRVLFSSALGFEILGAELSMPARIHLDTVPPGYEGFTTCPTFCESAVLARKVREVDYSRFNWDVGLDEILGERSSYPLDP